MKNPEHNRISHVSFLPSVISSEGIDFGKLEQLKSFVGQILEGEITSLPEAEHITLSHCARLLKKQEASLGEQDKDLIAPKNKPSQIAAK